MEARKALGDADLLSFQSMIRQPCESTIKKYDAMPTEENLAEAKGMLHGIFLGVMGTAHSIQSDFWRSDLMKIAHWTISEYQKALEQVDFIEKELSAMPSK